MSATTPRKLSAAEVEQYFDLMRQQGRPDPEPLKRWWQYCAATGRDPNESANPAQLDALGLRLARACQQWHIAHVQWGHDHGIGSLDPAEVRDAVLDSTGNIDEWAASESQRRRKISKGRTGVTGRPSVEQYWQRMGQHDGARQDDIHALAVEAFPNWRIDGQPPSKKTVNNLHRKARAMASIR